MKVHFATRIPEDILWFEQNVFFKTIIFFIKRFNFATILVIYSS